MSEKEVKKAFNAIEPEDGAQERMYANILKKAAAQRAAALEGNVDAPAAEGNATSKTVPLPARRPTPRWKRYSAMAACLALVTTLTIGFLHPFFAGDSEGNEPPVLGGSPFEDVQSAADFEEKLGFVIDAPEGAEMSPTAFTTARSPGWISPWTAAGTPEAAKLDGNFSRADGEAVGSTALNAEYGATLDRVSPDTWRAHWNRDDVSYYLTNFDGAEESAITEIADTLMKSN